MNHTVAKGQTLASIAARYGTTEKAVIELNKTYFDNLKAVNEKQKTDIALEAGITLVLNTKIPPVSPAAETKTEAKTVNIPALNVRASAEQGSDIVGAVISGETVHILRVVNGWAEILYGRGTAYVDSHFLK